MIRSLATLLLLAGLGFGVLSQGAPHVSAEPAATPPVNDVQAVNWGDPTPSPVVRTPTVAEAKAYARKRLGVRNYVCLDAIATRESGWRPLAHNRTSGAHGLGQALPWTKMRRFGPDAWANPVTQVKWMIAYVEGPRYRGACNAWAFWRVHRWY